MSSVLERVRKLIALTSSPNENEARNAAVLAVRLIREHHLVLSVPARRTSTPRGTPRATPARGAAGATPARGTAGASMPRAARRARDPAEPIRSPLGGDCPECGGRYRRGETVWWFPSGDGMHARCYASWVTKK